jgi:nucleoside-diphosphate-sugar epimerase
MRVLVTGASGFIGGHLVEALSAAGHDVRALVRRPVADGILGAAGAEIVRGDLRDADTAARAVAGCARVFNSAALVGEHGYTGSDYRAVNLEGAVTLARAALREGVERFVQVSTTGVYGPRTSGRADETTPTAPDDHYRATKLAAERALLGLHAGEGLPVVMVRLARILGRRSGSWLGLCRALAPGRLRLVGNGRNRWHAGHVDDVTALLTRCGDAAGIDGETYIACADDPLESREALALFAGALGVPAPTRSVPAAPYRALAAVDRLSYATVRRELGIASRYSLFLTDRAYSNAKASRELGVAPRATVADGVGETVEWYRSEGLL